MDARERTPAEDVDTFASGMAFGLMALRGRLRRIEDPDPADLQAAIEDMQARAQRMRKSLEPPVPK